MWWPCALAQLIIVASFVPSVQSAGKAAKTRSRLVGRLQRLEVCSDRPSAIQNMTATLNTLKDGTISVDTDYFVTKTAQSFSKFDLVLVKCREAVSSNSCEYYQTWTYSLGVCAVIMAQGMPWSSAMDKMQPSFKCPYVKGHYRTVNATANIDALSHVPLPWEGNVWRSSVIFFNERKEVHLCWTADMVFTRVKIN